MANEIIWWDGKKLEGELLALSVFPIESDVKAKKKHPILGAASSGTVNVLLLPNDYGPFLQRHQDATLVCYNAAFLHWLLDSHFNRSNDTESSKVLWAFSQDCRLIDVMLLDQHIRRCEAEDSTKANSFSHLVQRCIEVTLPDDEEIQQKVTAAWHEKGQNPQDPILELVLAVAAYTRGVYQHLLTKANAITDAVKKANQLPVENLPPLTNEEEEKIEANFKKNDGFSSSAPPYR